MRFDEEEKRLTFDVGDRFYATLVSSGTYDRKTDLCVSGRGHTESVEGLHGHEMKDHRPHWNHALRICDTGETLYEVMSADRYDLKLMEVADEVLR